MLNRNTLTRINNSTLYGNTYSVAEVMGDLTDAIFKTDLKTNVNLYRQNLQTEYIKGIAAILNQPTGYDNASIASLVYTLQNVRTMMGGAVSTNELTRAHRANLRFMIDKALSTNRN